MPDKIEMEKRTHFGYSFVRDDLRLLGRHLGFDIYIDDEEDDCVDVYIYDRKKQKRQRDAWCGRVVDVSKLVANIELSKRGRFWHVDLTKVDSNYRGKKLARKFYSFLIKKGYNLQAGDSQSPGGRYVWNELAKDRTITIIAKKSKYSKFIDFPTAGKKELKSKMFELFDSKAEIYAVSN